MTATRQRETRELLASLECTRSTAASTGARTAFSVQLTVPPLAGVILRLER